MKQITIIRHAESKFNSGEARNEGDRSNCRITERGKSQAQGLQGSYDCLVLSPLKRALETYVNSQIKTKRIVINELFREQKEDSRLNYLELEEIKPESREDVRKRAQEAKNFILSLPEDRIGIISHGIFTWYFLEACGQPPIPTYNCQETTFQIQN